MLRRTILKRLKWVLANMNRLNTPGFYLSTLGALKTAGALGLLAGFALPSVGVAAGIGLVLFFVSAIVFTLGAHWYSHPPNWERLLPILP
jgi:DoxX-like family